MPETSYFTYLETIKEYVVKEFQKTFFNCAGDMWLSELFLSRYDIPVAIRQLDGLFV